MKVAVYGTLKQKYPNHPVIKADTTKFLGYRQLQGLMFHMGFYPGVVLAEDVAKEHPCYDFVSRYSFACEIFEVDDTTLLKLDKLEGHPDFYYRTPIKDVKHGEVHIYTQRAAKQLVGKKKCIPGGFWYGEETSIMDVDFGDGTVKPRVLAWRGGTSTAIVIPPSNKEEVIVPKPMILTHYGLNDEFAEAEISILPTEIEIDLTLLDQVNEA